MNKDSKRGELSLFGQIAAWTGFVGSVLTLIIGIVHITAIDAEVIWPPKGIKWHEDTQKTTWRDPLFTLQPHILLDVWTPFVVGIIGITAHIAVDSVGSSLTKSWPRYFAFNLFEALFATVAYQGGMGIIFCFAPFLAAAFAVVLTFTSKKGHANLTLEERFGFVKQMQDKGRAIAQDN